MNQQEQAIFDIIQQLDQIARKYITSHKTLKTSPLKAAMWDAYQAGVQSVYAKATIDKSALAQGGKWTDNFTNKES